MSSVSQYQGIWASMVPYFASPVAASVAIVPVFYGFVAKSAQQLGNPIPRMSVKEALKGGCKTAPTIGVIVGTQMAVQRVVEKALVERSNDQKDRSPSFGAMFVISMFVSGGSVPALVAFNGQTMGRTVAASLRSLSARQAGAIVARETSFLFSLRVSGPMSEIMKRTFGENRAVEYASAFTSGAVGSLVGHPADTALTLWQQGRKVTNLRQAMRGGPVKALAVGCFSVCYKTVNELLESFSQ
jgi:hypothetical protein